MAGESSSEDTQMDDFGEIRIGGSARSTEEEEELQLALAILQLKHRVRKNPGFQPMRGATRRP